MKIKLLNSKDMREKTEKKNNDFFFLSLFNYRDYRLLILSILFYFH